MSVALNSAARSAEVARLRSEIQRVEKRRAEVPTTNVGDVLSPLFPDGGLRKGSTYSYGTSHSLLLALMAANSKDGNWSALVGMPDINIESAAGFGLNLERLVLVPAPGKKWLSVLSSLAEVVPVIAIHSAISPHEHEISRLTARLRDRGTVLLTSKEWPHSEGSLHLSDSLWHGLSVGGGALRSRTVTITSQLKRSPRDQHVRVLLPSPTGNLERAAAPVRKLRAMPTVA